VGRKKLTDASPREQDMLDALVKFHAEKGYMPTLRELIPIMGVRQTMCRNLLMGLHRKGYIVRNAGRARAITIVNRAA
jgi:repressor LexA